MGNLQLQNFFGIEYVSVVILVILGLLFLEDYYKHRFSQKCARKWLPSVPIIGCSYLFLQNTMFKVFIEYAQKFKEPFYFRAFFLNHYYTEEPDEIREILTNPITKEKGIVYSFLQWAIPDSIVLVEDSIWKKKRRYCAKALNQRRLNRLVQSFDKTANVLIEKFHSGMDKSLSETIERITIDSFMECLLGMDVSGDDELSALYRKADVYHTVKLVEDSVINRYIKPWLFFDFIFFRTKAGKDLLRRYNMYKSLLIQIIRDKKENLAPLKHDIEEKNLLDVMMESNVNEKDMLSEAVIFGTGSTQTTGLTLSFALTLLGMHPEIQEKLYREVADVLGTSSAVDYTHLVNLKYTEMVLNETMRIFPPLPFINRLATADLHLGTKIVSRNTEIMIGIMGAQRSSKFWKDPLKFVPERWTQEEVAKRDPYTFLALSGGPRNCIGGKYGMMMMKTILARIVNSYKLSSNNKSVEDIKFESNITLIVQSGLDCMFTRRNEDL